MINRINSSVDDCLKWIETQMLSYNRGTVGVYERLRIDVNRRVCWTRPDCNTEIARVILKRGREDNQDIFENIINWVLSVQDNDPMSAWYGSVPFYLHNGDLVDFSGRARFQNDNGKVLIGLMDIYDINGDERLKTAALKLADFWVRIQRDEGYYYQNDGGVTQGLYKGPCFIFWLAAGIARCYKETGDEKYLRSVEKAMKYLLSVQLDNGRFATTYELMRSEDWRPPSSENALAMFCLARILKYIPRDDWKRSFERVSDFVLSLCHKDGGVLNADADSLNASLQENPMICDLVYTEGFALMGFNEAYALTGDERFKNAAIKLADFLMNIQCKNESPLWDGAWRGTYNAETKCWDGRANQNNNIDEGGMYSIYTGWCASTIMDGLLGVKAIIENERE